MYSSLYIHIPFCAAKCDYCGFYSECDTGERHQAYLDRLFEEMRAQCGQCETLRSIFIGGGTPSMLSPAEWRSLFNVINECFTLAPDCEITAEANPESLSASHIECWAELGINRCSLGIQAFKEEDRRLIGRRGTLNRLPQIVRELDEHDIVRRNFDLIFNLPGQSLQVWREALLRAVDLGATHVSTYELMVEEGTPLAKRGFVGGDDEAFLRFWDETEQVLSQAGLHRYEISNFAKKNEECRHNLAVWKGGTYLGCGPAAWSFDGSARRGNVSNLDGWLKHAAQEVDVLPVKDRAVEILSFGLRLVKGWQWGEYQQITGYDARELRGEQLEECQRQGLVTMTNDGVVPTKQGLLFNDNLLSVILE